VRAANYGLVGKEYLATANDRLMVICQIESVRAVEAVPDIAKVPGVDMLFLGPNDLSGSIGKLGRYDDPEVAALVARAERAILDSGKPFGTITRPGRSLDGLVADGCKLVLAGSDLGFVREGAAAQVRAFRNAHGQEERPA
jgi:4-hydroxy-2-oxoheptanedioate aldolase